MIVEFNPSIEVQAKIKEAIRLHDKEKMTWDEVAKKVGYTRRYLMALKAWWLEHKGK